MKITIKLPPISKKNSQRIFYNPKTKKPFIMPSEKYVTYEKSAFYFLPVIDKPIDYPINIECKYYMPTKRKCDLVNLQEATLDVLVKGGIIEDDNYSIVQSMDGSIVLYDKENPRTEITIKKI